MLTIQIYSRDHIYKPLGTKVCDMSLHTAKESTLLTNMESQSSVKNDLPSWYSTVKPMSHILPESIRFYPAGQAVTSNAEYILLCCSMRITITS